MTAGRWPGGGEYGRVADHAAELDYLIKVFRAKLLESGPPVRLQPASVQVATRYVFWLQQDRGCTHDLFVCTRWPALEVSEPELAAARDGDGGGASPLLDPWRAPQRVLCVGPRRPDAHQLRLRGRVALLAAAASGVFCSLMESERARQSGARDPRVAVNRMAALFGAETAVRRRTTPARLFTGVRPASASMRLDAAHRVWR